MTFSASGPVAQDMKRSCLSKIRYITKSIAKAALKRTQRVSNKKLEVYKCVYCDAYHIGEKQRRA